MAQRFRQLFIPLEIGLNFFTMIEVLSQCRIYVGQRDSGEHANDFFGTIPAHLVPDDDVHDANAMARDARLAAAHAGCLRDVLYDDIFHDLTPIPWHAAESPTLTHPIVSRHQSSESACFSTGTLNSTCTCTRSFGVTSR
jgi:hypothetical protein